MVNTPTPLSLKKKKLHKRKYDKYTKCDSPKYQDFWLGKNNQVQILLI